MAELDDAAADDAAATAVEDEDEVEGEGSGGWTLDDTRLVDATTAGFKCCFFGSAEDEEEGTFSNDSFRLIAPRLVLEDVGGRGGAGGVAITGFTFRLTAGDSLTMDRGGTGTAEDEDDDGGVEAGEEANPEREGRSNPDLLRCSTTW